MEGLQQKLEYKENLSMVGLTQGFVFIILFLLAEKQLSKTKSSTNMSKTQIVRK